MCVGLFHPYVYCLGLELVVLVRLGVTRWELDVGVTPKMSLGTTRSELEVGEENNTCKT